MATLTHSQRSRRETHQVFFARALSTRRQQE